MNRPPGLGKNTLQGIVRPTASDDQRRRNAQAMSSQSGHGTSQDTTSWRRWFRRQREPAEQQTSQPHAQPTQVLSRTQADFVKNTDTKSALQQLVPSKMNGCYIGSFEPTYGEGASTVELDRGISRTTIYSAQALLQVESRGGLCAGAGFFISPDGFFLTARRVVGEVGSEEVNSVAVLSSGAKVSFVPVADIEDFVLMKVNGLSISPCLYPEERPTQVSSVVVIGFGTAAGHPKVTTGHVSSCRVRGEREKQVNRLRHAIVDKGVCGGPVMSLASGCFIGVIYDTSDVGQASFHVLTSGSILWRNLQFEMEKYRLENSD